MCALTVLVYMPGLRGGYILDDFPNIVANEALHVTTSSLQAWLQAIWSSPSSEFLRPLASLSFAINHYFTGLDPMPMKSVNLAIHLLNGALLLVLLRRIQALARPDDGLGQRRWLAPLVTAAWLLHPVNLTAVLYVVQRMESLAQVFVLAGLLAYVSARVRQISGESGGWRLWAAVPAMMICGIASKESAALLPLYALLLEITVLRAAPYTRSTRNELIFFYALLLVFPAMIGLAWLLPHYAMPASYAARPFTLVQRLLTEPRVLMDYIGWILLPLPGSFALYHDDYSFSRGLFHPPTTPLALFCIVAMAAMALFPLRKRRPLVALGVCWFLAAHLLTATFIPLELVYEHRNYFACAGLLLAAFDLLLPGDDEMQFRSLRWALAGSFLVLCALVTTLRALDWQHPVQLAAAEAERHPGSARATYELGRALVILTEYHADSPFLPRAFDALSKAAAVPGASIQPEVVMVELAARTGEPVQREWLGSALRKLQAHRPTVEDRAALSRISECFKDRVCQEGDDELRRMFYAALSHDPPDPATLYAYAIYAYNVMHDANLALAMARDAAARSGRDPQYRINLAAFLVDLGQLEAARIELGKLESRNRFGQLDVPIDLLKERIRAAAGKTDAH
jgi:protein O-mannosyl-transferase